MKIQYGRTEWWPVITDDGDYDGEIDEALWKRYLAAKDVFEDLWGEVQTELEEF